MNRMSRIATLTLCGAMLSLIACEENKPQPPATTPDKPVVTKVTPKPLLSALPVDNSVTFGKGLHKVGDIRTSKKSGVINLAMDVKGTEKTIETSANETLNEEILAVDGDKITKVKLQFAEKTENTKLADKPTEKKSPLAGKTFIVDMSAEAPKVLDEKEKPAAKKDADLVLKAYTGDYNPFASSVAGKTFKPNQKLADVELLKTNLTKTLGEDTVIEKLDLTFKSKQEDNGTFELEMKLSQGKDKMKLAFDVKGTVVMSLKDARMMKFEMNGNTSAPEAKVDDKVDAKAGDKPADKAAKTAAKDAKAEPTPKGTIKMTIDFTYPKAEAAKTDDKAADKAGDKAEDKAADKAGAKPADKAADTKKPAEAAKH